MDPQVRQFKDFLQLYNSITERCFNTCVDNLFNRRVQENEDTCVSFCVDKFAKVNQRLMGTYIEVQSSINEKRMAEYESQIKEAEAQAVAAQQKEQLETQVPAIELEALAEATN